MKKEIVAVLIIFVVIFSVYYFSQRNVLFSPSENEISASSGAIMEGTPTGIGTNPDCDSIKAVFTPEWKDKCKESCDYFQEPEECKRKIDKQTTIKYCKPNDACLARHNVERKDVKYECILDQDGNVAMLKCDEFICYGRGTIFMPCNCQTASSS